MFVEVLAHLILRRRNEPQADAVADQAGGGADTEGQAIEEGVEHAGMAAELADALFAPGQVVDLLVGRLFHRFAHTRQARSQRLALVERLGTDLAGMVDAHEAGHVASFAFAQFGVRLDHGGRGAAGLPAERQQGAQG